MEGQFPHRDVREGKNHESDCDIQMKNGDVMKIELYPETAPQHRRLLRQALPGWVLRWAGIPPRHPRLHDPGRRPAGQRHGRPGFTIKGEFRQNGVINPLKHERGVISMARTQMPNSAGSQFFIMHADAPYLDGAYAALRPGDRGHRGRGPHRGAADRLRRPAAGVPRDGARHGGDLRHGVQAGAQRALRRHNKRRPVQRDASACRKRSPEGGLFSHWRFSN